MNAVGSSGSQFRSTRESNDSALFCCNFMPFKMIRAFRTFMPVEKGTGLQSREFYVSPFCPRALFGTFTRSDLTVSNETLPPCVPCQDFTLDFYFRQFWTDPRLAFKKRTGVETLSVGSEFIKNIWVPDTFFVNEKQSYFHIATTSNEFIRIHHSGSITRSIRWVQTISLTICSICAFFILSYLLSGHEKPEFLIVKATEYINCL